MLFYTSDQLKWMRRTVGNCIQITFRAILGMKETPTANENPSECTGCDVITEVKTNSVIIKVFFLGVDGPLHLNAPRFLVSFESELTVETKVN